jgi:D-amino-acid dehydrogenase
MKVVVLGAGVVGTASAWYLSQAGHEVRVIDRQSAAGMETSFANGGQISVSHAEPWASPDAPWKALKWLAREDAPLLFRLRADPEQWRWGLKFLRECTPERFGLNVRQLVRLGLYSRASLQALRRDTGIAYDHLQRGILHYYTDAREFAAGEAAAEVMRELGCERTQLTPAECAAREPALKPSQHLLAGGTYTPDDESGDAHKFTQELAKKCREKGVVFDFDVVIEGFEFNGQEIQGVKTNKSPVRADAYILALGSYSPLLARPLGIRLDVYPLKGYSVTMPVKDPAAAWSVSLTDDSHKLVFSRLGERLRIAGTAELNGYNTEINAVRCQAIVKRVMEIFPGAGEPRQAQFWAGLRPATPSNVPYIGRTKYRNLFLNTGHGTLGWTHSCGSGRALADIVSGRRPEVDFNFR